MTEDSSLLVPTHVHWRRFDSEIVLIDLKGGEYYGLTEVAAAAFEHVAEGRTFGELVNDLVERYDVGRAELQSDLKDLLDRLVGLGLLATR